MSETPDQIDALAQELMDGLPRNVSGGCIIAALTLTLAVWLEAAPEGVREEIRRRCISVLSGKPNA